MVNGSKKVELLITSRQKCDKKKKKNWCKKKRLSFKTVKQSESDACAFSSQVRIDRRINAALRSLSVSRKA